MMYECERRSDNEISKYTQCVRVHACVHVCDANVSRHLAGPKVTLAVTDQSGLAD